MIKKMITLFAVCFFAISIFTGCNRGEAEVESEVAVSDIMQKLTEEFELPMMGTIEGEELESMFYLQEDLLAQYAILASMTIVHADNLAIVKANSEDDVAAIKEALEKRQADVIQSFEGYLPEPLAVAQNARIVESGRYVALLMVEDVDRAEDIFFDMLSN